ncbi:hypothetical protein Daus18300_011826 [Diaporthe australafricana]|uniref:Alpha/beta hydrolase fold-3 domain-containing protein n=1 Tax=Diaporthe australafricana TaxID=127596 RepID=A0ABR3W542_9PEZI
MELHHRTNRSVFSLVLQSLIRPFKPHLVAPKKTFPAGSPRLKHDRKYKGGVGVVERQHQDIWLYDMASHSSSSSSSNTATTPPPSKRLRMYYIAGGGWQSPPSGQHWKFCAELVQKVPGLTVTIVSAPLAPASPASVAFPALKRLYASLLEQGSRDGEQVMFAGDSSGGNLVLSLALDALLSDNDKKEDGRGTTDATTTRPLALLVISPAVDLRPMEARGPEMETLARRDPVLTVGSHNSEAEAFARGVDPALAWMSPAVGDVGVLARAGVRLVGVTGGHDILTPAALGFRDACAGAGVGGAWLHWERQMHCFPLAFMYGLPEAVAAKDWIVEQIRGL